MATLPETNEYPAGIYQIETTDPALGGPPNEATKAGLTNIPAQQLAKRTHWLKTRVDQLLAAVVSATTSVAGIVRLSSATNSTSETMAATPAAVKAVNDNAETRALKSTAITTSGLATGGGTLAQTRDVSVPVATVAEAQEGSVNNRAMTPLRVAQFVTAKYAGRSLDQNGYQVLPSGLIMQWGFAYIPEPGLAQINFPIAFPSQCFNVVLGDNATDTINNVHIVSAADLTRFGFTGRAKQHTGIGISSFLYFLALGR